MQKQIKNLMTIVLQIYPNGEYTQGVDTSQRRKSRPERISDEMHKKSYPPEGMSALVADMNAEIYKCTYAEGTEFMSAQNSKWTYLCADIEGFHWAVEDIHGYTFITCTQDSPDRMVGKGVLTPPLVHQTVESCENPKNSRKACLGMTKAMSRNIRNACFVLQEKYGKDRLSFLTLTVPDLPQEGLEAVCINWDKLVHRFNDWLRLKLKAKGMEFEYVYCTEIQLKRLQKRGEYAPHLHMVFRGRYGKKSAWAVTPKQCRQEWVRAIRSVFSGVFKSDACENLQVVKRSAGGYLSKYMSKTSNSIPQDAGSSVIVRLRTQWGGMSRSLSRAIRQAKCTFRGTQDRGFNTAVFLRCVPRLLENGLVIYHREGQIPLGVSSDGISTKYLRVSVGCLKQALWHGGLNAVWDFLQPEFDRAMC